MPSRSSGQGQIRYEYAHGYRHVENKLPATTTSRFGVGSISKSFTAIALLQLQEQGKLTVTDPVTRYLPALRFPGAEHVTPMSPLGARGRTRVHNVDQLIALIAEIEFVAIAPPGCVMSYSNDGWCLLGAVRERVSDGRGILHASSLRQMTTPYLPVTPTAAYGYGISIEAVAGVGTVIGHGGGDLGVAAYFGTFIAEVTKSRHRFYMEAGELLLESGAATYKPIYIGDNTVFVPGTPIPRNRSPSPLMRAACSTACGRAPASSYPRTNSTKARIRRGANWQTIP